MATFNQQNQKVYGEQYQGDTVNVTHGTHSPIGARAVVVEFDRALAAVRELEVDDETRAKVTAELTAARSELEAGDTGAARNRLNRYLEVGGKATEIVSKLMSALGGLAGG